MITPRQIAPVATRQLAAWQSYARRWQLILQLRTTGKDHLLGPGVEQWHLTCAGLGNMLDSGPWEECGQTILVVHDGSNPYSFDSIQLLDRIVGHLRQRHQGLEKMMDDES